MVVKNHFADTRERRQRVEDLRAKLHVCLHGLPLFGIERAVLAQDAFRNTDLADVVKHGTQTNLFHFLVFDPHGFCDQRRIRRDFLRVALGVVILGVDRQGQRGDGVKHRVRESLPTLGRGRG